MYICRTDRRYMYICRPTVESKIEIKSESATSTDSSNLIAYLSSSAYATFIYFHDIKNDYRVDKFKIKLGWPMCVKCT